MDNLGSKAGAGSDVSSTEYAHAKSNWKAPALQIDGTGPQAQAGSSSFASSYGAAVTPGSEKSSDEGSDLSNYRKNPRNSILDEDAPTWIKSPFFMPATPSQWPSDLDISDGKGSAAASGPPSAVNSFRHACLQANTQGAAASLAPPEMPAASEGGPHDQTPGRANSFLRSPKFKHQRSMSTSHAITPGRRQSLPAYLGSSDSEKSDVSETSGHESDSSLCSDSSDDVKAASDSTFKGASDDVMGESSPTPAKNKTLRKKNKMAKVAAFVERTVGTVSHQLRRSQSQLGIEHLTLTDEIAKLTEADALITTANEPSKAKLGEQLLVVFDMDRTMVGDLTSLSDRDNLETNIEWTWWPPDKVRGLDADFIEPYLRRGMLRAGMVDYLYFLRDIGATMVVYTHSEFVWAKKVCEAMEAVAGFKFVKHLFGRKDCKDGHPEFPARKSLQFVCEVMQREYSEEFEWLSVDRCLMFDDDSNALGGSDKQRLVKVPAYEYWEPCKWDEVLDEEFLFENTDENVQILTDSVVQWKLAPPSFGKVNLTEEDEKETEKWEAMKSKRQKLHMAYNKMAMKDRLWVDVKEYMEKLVSLDDDTMETLPNRIRTNI